MNYSEHKRGKGYGSSEGAVVTPEGSKEENDKSDVNVDDISWVSTSDEEEKGDDDDDKSDEEQAEEDQDQKDQSDDDIIGTLVTMSQKENPEVPRSSSSRSLSSNYGNQFLNLSSDASLVGTIKETTDAEINSFCPKSVHLVVDEYLGSTIGDTFQKVLQKHTEELIQQFPQTSVFEIMKVKQEQSAKEKVPKFSSTPYDPQADEEHK
ncbi:hypothetical protein Tco_1525935 [Tanacetum coccineum]